MKEFIDKLIARLEELFCGEYDTEYIKKDDVISIVNELAEEHKDKDCSKCSRRSWYQIGYADAEKKFAEEYNGGWIACKIELPKLYTEVLGYGIDGHIYLITLYDTEIYGKVWRQWNGGDIRLKFIDAWQPLPQPYQPKGE